MSRFRKLLSALVLCATVMCLLSIWLITPVPTRRQLCKDLESYLLFSECLAQNSTLDVLHSAFEPGKATIDDVHTGLGQYLEKKVEYNRIFEDYSIGQSRLDRLVPIRFWSGYEFLYDQNGTLLSIDIVD